MLPGDVREDAVAQWLGEALRCGLTCSLVERHRELGRHGTFEDACARTQLRVRGLGPGARLSFRNGPDVQINEITAVDTHRQRPSSPIFRTARKETFSRLASVRWSQTGRHCQTAQCVHVLFRTTADVRAFVHGVNAARQFGVRGTLTGRCSEEFTGVADPSPWQIERGREIFSLVLSQWRGLKVRELLLGNNPNSQSQLLGGEPTEGVDASACELNDPLWGLCENASVHILWQEALGDRTATQLPEAELRELVARGVPLKHRHALWRSWVRDTSGTAPMVDLETLEASAPSEASAQILLDIPRTHSQWLKRGQQEALSRVLHAYAALDPTVGYCQGMNFIVMIFLLLGFDERASFVGLCYIMEHICPQYHGPSLEGYIRDTAVFGILVHHLLPQVNLQLDELEISMSSIALDHFLTLSSRNLPLGAVARLWDLVLPDGTAALFASFLAFLELYFLRAAGYGFESLPGKGALCGRSARSMPAIDLEACKHACEEGDYGAFVVYRGRASFFRKPASQCRQDLRDVPDSTVYISFRSEAMDAGILTLQEANAETAANPGAAAVHREPASVMDRFKALTRQGMRQDLDKVLERARYWLQALPSELIERLRMELVADRQVEHEDVGFTR